MSTRIHINIYTDTYLYIDTYKYNSLYIYDYMHMCICTVYVLCMCTHTYTESKRIFSFARCESSGDKLNNINVCNTGWTLKMIKLTN